MKLKRFKMFAALAVAGAIGFAATAQSSSDGTTDFSAFKLITERNIFDPNRYPHSSHHRERSRTTSRSAPAFALVGTMNYQKGMFAFFDGNNSDYRKVLEKNGVVAGFTVTDITLAGVTLKPAGTNATPINLKIGAQMRLNGETWEPAGSSESFTDNATTENTPAAATDENNSSASTSSADSGAPVSDVLKRLMQLRAQETK